jgi:hypothetical protein
VSPRRKMKNRLKKKKKWKKKKNQNRRRRKFGKTLNKCLSRKNRNNNKIRY